MSGLLHAIRKKILGDKLYTACNNNQATEKDLETILKNFSDLSIDDIKSICYMRTEKQIDDVKHKILGDTGYFCKEDGIPIPKKRISQYKINKLQKVLSDEEFLQLCKTSGKFEATVADILKIILFDKKGNMISNMKENISRKVVSKINLLIEFLQPNISESRKQEIKQRNKNMTIVNNNHFFYSSLPVDIKKEDFELYKIVWCSPELSQSLLYMLGKEKALIQPVFYKFKFAYDLFILNSDDMDNTNIFENILEHETVERIKHLYPFEFGNNLNVLCVIEAINIIVRSVENTNNYRIYGYRNRFDQNELAIIDYNHVVNKNTIEKAIFEEVQLLDQRKTLLQGMQNFPITLKFPFYDNTLYNEYMDKLNINEEEDAPHLNKDDFHVFLNTMLITEGGIKESYRVSCPIARYVVKYYYENKPSEKHYFRCTEIYDDSIPDYEKIII